MDTASKNIIQPNYTDSLDVNVNVEVKKGGVMPAVDLSIISSPSDQLVENGKTLYSTNCSSCHGEEGRGNGVAAAALNPPPRNFYDESGWKNGRDFNGMYKTLQEGIAGGGMIAYDFLQVEDRIAIIHYVRTFAEFPIITEESVAELDQNWELSKGVISPNNITLEMAQEKIVSETGLDLVENLSSAMEKLDSYTDRKTVDLFNRVIENKEKALMIFLRDFAGNDNSSEFIDRIVTYPSQSGFKSSVSLLSNEQLNDLFILLSNSFS